jgi:hypothetical protein
LEGRGWANFFQSSNVVELLLVDDTLTTNCTIKILEVIPKTTSHQDRFTSFDWNLSSATMSKAAPCYESPVFSLDGHPDLKLRMILKNHDAPFVQIHLIPAELKSAKIRLTHLIWVEDTRTGIRFPTWGKFLVICG